jgi:hypothetical protein
MLPAVERLSLKCHGAQESVSVQGWSEGMMSCRHKTICLAT